MEKTSFPGTASTKAWWWPLVGAVLQYTALYCIMRAAPDAELATMILALTAPPSHVSWVSTTGSRDGGRNQHHPIIIPQDCASWSALAAPRAETSLLFIPFAAGPCLRQGSASGELAEGGARPPHRPRPYRWTHWDTLVSHGLQMLPYPTVFPIVYACDHHTACPLSS